MNTNYTVRYVSDKGWRKYPNQQAPSTGTPLIEKSLFDIFELCKCLPDDGKKGEHGAIFTYDKETVGNASVGYYDSLMTGGVIFVDIDHIPSSLVDDIFEKFDDINFECNSAIIGCQKSSSYYRRPGTDDTGVHFFLASRPCNGFDYVEFSSYSLALVALAIKKALGVDVRKYDRRKENTDNVDKVLDTSSCKISQRSFLYHSDYRYNEVVIPITDEAYDLNSSILKKEYPELFKFEHYSTQDLTPVDLTGVNVTAGENLGKIQLDYSKECIISNFLSATGMEPDKVLIIMLEIDSRDRREYLYKHKQTLENHLRQIIRTSKTQKISAAGKKMAEEMLEACGVTVAENRTENIEKQEENRITRIEMDDDKFMSDYVDKVEKFIVKEQVLTISAPTGTGKTTMLEKLTKKYHKNSVILVPFNVTNKLYAWSNIVSSKSESSFEPGKINTMVWDQFVKHYNEIENSPTDVIFVDESHALFLDRTYRDSAVQVWGKFQMWMQRGKKIVFISATPAGEIQKLNSRVLEFVKKDDRDVKVNILYTNDTLSSLERDLRSNFFDKVCVFSDRDVKILYARLCADGLSHDARIYHSLWRENVEELKRNERLDHRMNLLTCIAFNGLNIRNTGEKICILVRYTEGDTTLNEIIQIVGRFRNNKDITLNIYVDDKFKSFDDLEELFHNAKTITDCEDNAELKSEYFERLSEETVQNSLKEIEAYEKMWTLGRIMSELKSRYLVKIETVTDKVDESDIVKRVNPIKRQASELMVGFLRGEMTVGELERRYKGTDMEDFILTWRRELNNVKYLAGGCGGVIDAVVEECGKQNTLVDNAIKKMKRIIWVVGMNEVQWDQEVAGRDGLGKSLKGDKMIKSALSNWRKDDSMREKYAEYVQEYVEGSVAGIEVGDPGSLFDPLFEAVVSNIKKDKVQTFNNRSVASSKERKKHLYRCVETGVSKTKQEWMQELKCNEDRFKYLIKRRVYVKE